MTNGYERRLWIYGVWQSHLSFDLHIRLVLLQLQT